jgi:hypothetical protein
MSTTQGGVDGGPPKHYAFTAGEITHKTMIGAS